LRFVSKYFKSNTQENLMPGYFFTSTITNSEQRSLVYKIEGRSAYVSD